MGNTATKSKKGYPFGFYACSLGFTFERCAFYTVKWLLAIWLATETTSKMGGMGLTSVEAGKISAYFVAATYITPMIGGYLADLRSSWYDSYGCRLSCRMAGNKLNTGMGNDYPRCRWYRFIQR